MGDLRHKKAKQIQHGRRGARQHDLIQINDKQRDNKTHNDRGSTSEIENDIGKKREMRDEEYDGSQGSDFRPDAGQLLVEECARVNSWGDIQYAELRMESQHA